MSLQEAASQVGRRATKFCPANVQKFKIGWQKEFHGKKLLNLLTRLRRSNIFGIRRLIPNREHITWREPTVTPRRKISE